MKHQNGVSSIFIIILVILILGGGLTWYLVNQDQNVEDNTNLNISPISNNNTNKVTEWKTFINNNYHFTVDYPTSWFYIPDAVTGPPPPATNSFASVADISDYKYSSFFIYVADLSGETLETWSEIGLLEQDGYQKTNIKVDGENGIKLTRNTHENDTGATVYVTNNNYMYRISWGSTTQELNTTNSNIQENMLNNFEFINPLVTDFEQSGNLSQPAGENYWNLVWDEPGSPALNKKLTFDTMDFISTCIKGFSRPKCTDAMTNNLFDEDSTVIVQGIINPVDNNEIFVTYITEL
ncbi:MAG: hypothetical protein ACNFW9_05745 [Candidatus Kerfeldbacteria bacterium]